MYMAEVLDAVCAKRKLDNPKEYALVLDLKPVKLFIPLDRTVKSLQGKRDLMLIQKNMLQNYGVDMGKRITGRSSDPNGKIGIWHPGFGADTGLSSVDLQENVGCSGATVCARLHHCLQS